MAFLDEAEPFDIASLERERELQTAKRTRRRRSGGSIPDDERQEIATRVLDFFTQDIADRSEEVDRRLQRMAKLYMWTEGTDFPWPGASDIGLADMLEKGLHVQDTLVNATLAQRPTISAKTAAGEPDTERERRVDRLLDYQFFVERPGETVVNELAQAFHDDGVFTAFVPWVKEWRQAREIKDFPPIPDDQLPRQYFAALLRVEFPERIAIPTGRGEGWDWTLEPRGEGEAKTEKVSFYTTKSGVEMVRRHEQVVYEGPPVLVMDWEDVLYPARSANLQAPGPSNPNGAAHVILRSRPTVAEIRQLKKDGFYDLLTDEDMTSIENAAAQDQDDPEKKQLDAMQGRTESVPDTKAKDHRRLTRLLCFDLYDLDGDGMAEDIVWWVIKETKTIVRARPLSDFYPGTPTRRPLAEAPYIRRKGRREGISGPEVIEGLHDAMKAVFDQSVNAGSLAISPPGFYRPHGTMNPEVLQWDLGELLPLGDPQRDINFPQIGNPQAQGFMLNIISLIGQWEERLTKTGDLQLGRVPPGRSSALRTTGNMALLQGQGEARPERMLRNFFLGLADIYSLMLAWDQAKLPAGKRIRLAGWVDPGEDPLITIPNRSEISGVFEFEFKANVLNTSKAAMQQALEDEVSLLLTPLAFQIGVSDQETSYRLMRDFVISRGGDADSHMKPPTPGAAEEKIMAEEALQLITQGILPQGAPAEQGGAQEHLQKLQEFAQSDDFGILDQLTGQIFVAWFQQMTLKAQQEQSQQQLLAAAAQLQGQQGQGQPGRPGVPQVPPEGPPPVSGGAELIDESLPTAGGGGDNQ